MSYQLTFGANHQVITFVYLIATAMTKCLTKKKKHMTDFVVLDSMDHACALLIWKMCICSGLMEEDCNDGY